MEEENKNIKPEDFTGGIERDNPQGYRSTKPYTDFRYAVEKYSQNKLKKKLFRHPGREIQNLDEKGYGVVATMPIKKGEVVEECVVAFETIEPGWEYLDGAMHARNQNVLSSYRFAGPTSNHPTTEGTKHAQCWVVPFGDAAIYNHSTEPNLMWYHESAQRLMVFIAIRDIEPGEELCHSYASRTIGDEEYMELVKGRHYHPQFMRDPIKLKPRLAPDASMKPPTGPATIQPDLSTNIQDQLDPKDLEYKPAPQPTVPSNAYKNYVKEEKFPNRDPKKIDKVFDKIGNIDPNWEPPQRGEKKGTKDFLKTTKKGTPASFEHSVKQTTKSNNKD